MSFSSFSGIIARATAKHVETVSASAEGVSTSAGVIYNLTGAVTAFAEAEIAPAKATNSFCRSSNSSS